MRLSLTFHGRKGIPVVSRIALLDTRFLEYQHACICTIQTTLNAGTIFITLFPNYNMPLKDPHLSTCMKVQLQITRAPSVSTTSAATLQHQMIYRIQNHAFDLAIPNPHSDSALLLNVNSTIASSCTYVPRQLSRQELTKLLPDSWVTSYEKHHMDTRPIQTVDP